jgi:hypothetical protein
MVATILCAAMFSVSVLSGMLGVGVAFAAVPILGIAGLDLVNGVQPIALFLNGITALFSAISFARAGFVDWPRSCRLAVMTSIFSPLGAWVAEWVRESALWGAYFAAVFVVVYLLLNNRRKTERPLPFAVILLISAPASAISGLLGVGPGFLLVPIMIFVGFGARSAAAMNAVAVTPASFLSLIPHLGHASIDGGIVLPIGLASAGGALLGGYLSSTYVSEIALRRLFVVVIVALSLYKGISLGGAHLREVVNYGGCSEEVMWTTAQTKPCQVSN